MSTRSMTGHGRAAVERAGIRVEVEISSVNRKQLDIQLALPRTLAPLEARIQEEIGSVLSRGRLNVDIRVRQTTRTRSPKISFNIPMAKAYLRTIRAASRQLRIPEEPSLSRLLELPGIIHVETAMENPERVWPVLRAALREALGRLDGMRRREGAALARDLRRRLAGLGRLAGQIRAHAPAVAQRYRTALHARLSAIRREIDLNDERIDREVLLFADRSDITEELTRIDSHLQQAIVLLRSEQAAGKSLDFLAQELNREINTIGSKSGDAAISHRVVAFKAELERLREQVQNIQ